MKHQGGIQSELDSTRANVAEKDRTISQLRQALAALERTSEERTSELVAMKEELSELRNVKEANKQLRKQVEEEKARSVILGQRLSEKEKVT